MYLCFRVVPLLTARSYREPTTIAKRLWSVIIPFLTARAIGIVPSLIDHHLRVCFRAVPFLTARLYWEPTAKAERLLCDDSVSNGPCDRD